MRIETVKAFGQPMSDLVERRIAGLKPGYYTRMGAAIRHAAADLARQHNRKKLLLILTAVLLPIGVALTFMGSSGIREANAALEGQSQDQGRAAVQAVETVDACLGEVVSAVRETGGVCVITADHGNADHMLEPDGSPNTAHSLNPVPLIVTGAGELALRGGGVLADVAPTVLDLLDIEQPTAMTGRSLIERR